MFCVEWVSIQLFERICSSIGISESDESVSVAGSKNDSIYATVMGALPVAISHLFVPLH
jgi:hypothetical protein